MRGWSFAVVVATLGGAVASPASPPTTWADWVGDWDGKLKWSSCTTDGEPSGTFAFDATDGAVAIDLTQAGDALGPVTLVEADNGGWVGQHADVTAHVTRDAAGLQLAVDLRSGCAMRATLHRASFGIAACDELDAWARIENRCTKLTRPALENAARLARQRTEWSKARGDAVTKLAAQCKARSTKVQAELVDAGCAPNPDPLIGMRGAECQGLRATAAKYSRCTNLPSDLTADVVRDATELAASAQTADSDAALHVVETHCRQLRERLVSTAKQAGCLP